MTMVTTTGIVETGLVSLKTFISARSGSRFNGEQIEARLCIDSKVDVVRRLQRKKPAVVVKTKS